MKVSVVMITYQQEPFIKQAIEGVLMQQCNFEIELIIANDCSPDNTESVVNNSIKNHPNGSWIKYTRHSKNKGMMGNSLWSLEQAQGKYIAICEGDDYWTDPLKLQRQVDFLEQNDDYVIHFENKLNVDENGKILKNAESNYVKDVFGIKDILLKDNPIYTVTTAFRNIKELKSILNKNMLPYPYGDLGLWIFLLYYSSKKVKYSAVISAAYRIHDKGIFSKANDIEKWKNFVTTNQLHLQLYPDLYPNENKKRIIELQIKYLKGLLTVNKVESVKFYFTNFIKLNTKFPIRDFWYALRKY